MNNLELRYCTQFAQYNLLSYYNVQTYRATHGLEIIAATFSLRSIDHINDNGT